MTHPDAYSQTEVGSLELLKKLCKKDGIPLFICRGKDLPDGWQRYSMLDFGVEKHHSALRYSRSS